MSTPSPHPKQTLGVILVTSPPRPGLPYSATESLHHWILPPWQPLPQPPHRSRLLDYDNRLLAGLPDLSRSIRSTLLTAQEQSDGTALPKHCGWPSPPTKKARLLSQSPGSSKYGHSSDELALLLCPHHVPCAPAPPDGSGVPALTVHFAPYICSHYSLCCSLLPACAIPPHPSNATCSIKPSSTPPPHLTHTDIHAVSSWLSERSEQSSVTVFVSVPIRLPVGTPAEESHFHPR